MPTGGSGGGKGEGDPAAPGERGRDMHGARGQRGPHGQSTPRSGVGDLGSAPRSGTPSEVGIPEGGGREEREFSALWEDPGPGCAPRFWGGPPSPHEVGSGSAWSHRSPLSSKTGISPDGRTERIFNASIQRGGAPTLKIRVRRRKPRVPLRSPRRRERRS